MFIEKKIGRDMNSRVGPRIWIIFYFEIVRLNTAVGGRPHCLTDQGFKLIIVGDTIDKTLIYINIYIHQ